MKFTHALVFISIELVNLITLNSRLWYISKGFERALA